VWVNDPGMSCCGNLEHIEHDHFFDPAVRAVLAAPASITVAHGRVPHAAPTIGNSTKQFCVGQRLMARSAPSCWSAFLSK
jgi:hypothetical protein